jgi:hypothetical protein
MMAQTFFQRYSPHEQTLDVSLYRLKRKLEEAKGDQRTEGIRRLIEDYTTFKVEVAFKDGRVTSRKIGIIDPAG